MKVSLGDSPKISSRGPISDNRKSVSWLAKNGPW